MALRMNVAHIAGLLEGGFKLRCEVAHGHLHVNYIFGSKARHRCRADVVYAKSQFAQGVAQVIGYRGELVRPFRPVINYHDGVGVLQPGSPDTGRWDSTM